MNTLEKDEFSASVRHIERFSKSGIPIYNSKVPDMACRRTRRMRRRKTGNCKALHTNAVIMDICRAICSD